MATARSTSPLNDGTGQCTANGLSSTGYIANLPDVDNYPYCWRDPGSRAA